MLVVRSRPGRGAVQEHSRENSPEDRTIRVDKPMARTEVEGRLGLVRIE